MEGALHGRRVQALRGRGVPGARGGGLPGPGERHERVRPHRAPAHRRGDLGARGPPREDHGRRAASALEISASGKSRRRANKCFWSRRFVFYAIWVIMHQYFTRFGS